MNTDTIPTKGYIRRFRLAELLGVSVSAVISSSARKNYSVPCLKSPPAIVAS